MTPRGRSLPPIRIARPHVGRRSRGRARADRARALRDGDDRRARAASDRGPDDPARDIAGDLAPAGPAAGGGGRFARASSSARIPTFDQTRCGVAFPALLLVLYAVGSRCDRRDGPPVASSTGLGGDRLPRSDRSSSSGAARHDRSVLPAVRGHLGRGRARRLPPAYGGGAPGSAPGELEDQRAQTAQLAVEIERTRLTSELDGAVRERLGEIVQLAEEGEHDPAADPDTSRRAFARIEAAGRTSLDEMRGLLGALRSDEPAPRAPRPTLAELDVLLAEARAGGRVVELDVSGERAPAAGRDRARRLPHPRARARGDRDRAALTPISVGLRFAADSLEVEVEGDHLPSGGRRGRADRGRARAGRGERRQSQPSVRGRAAARSSARACRSSPSMRERLTRLEQARWFDLGLALALFAVGLLEIGRRSPSRENPLNDPQAPLIAVGFGRRVPCAVAAWRRHALAAARAVVAISDDRGPRRRSCPQRRHDAAGDVRPGVRASASRQLDVGRDASRPPRLLPCCSWARSVLDARQVGPGPVRDRPLGRRPRPAFPARDGPLSSSAARASSRREQDAYARLSVRRERARIARELHDVVSHNLAVMVVQAGAGRVAPPGSRGARCRALPEHPAGRASTASRSCRGWRDMLEPRPGDIVGGAARRCGSTCSSSMRERPGSRCDSDASRRGRSAIAPETSSRRAYRIVQEALTNAVKHAPGSTLAVRVGFGAGMLELEVRDDGGRASTTSGLVASGSGTGLRGLAQRVSELGGDLQRGASPAAAGASPRVCRVDRRHARRTRPASPPWGDPPIPSRWDDRQPRLTLTASSRQPPAGTTRGITCSRAPGPGGCARSPRWPRRASSPSSHRRLRRVGADPGRRPDDLLHGDRQGQEPLLHRRHRAEVARQARARSCHPATQLVYSQDAARPERQEIGKLYGRAPRSSARRFTRAAISATRLLVRRRDDRHRRSLANRRADHYRRRHRWHRRLRQRPRHLSLQEQRRPKNDVTITLAG